MVPIKLNYLGDLRCQATHLPSQVSLLTDAPIDNQGKGESFSPTDLVTTALGTCMMTIIGIKANQKQISLQGMSCDLEKHMTTSPPRRIQKLVVKLNLPIHADHPERHLLEAAAHSCPVHHSLHPDIEVDLQFIYQSSDQ